MSPQAPLGDRSLRQQDVEQIATIARSVHGPGRAVVQQQVLDDGSRVARVIDGVDRTVTGGAELFMRAERMLDALSEEGFVAEMKAPPACLWFDVEVVSRDRDHQRSG